MKEIILNSRSCLLFLLSTMILVSCTTDGTDQTSALVDTALELRGTCHYNCDPGSNSGVTIVTSQTVGNLCCVTFSIKGGGEGNPNLCYLLRTWDGQDEEKYFGNTVDMENEFEVCFVQEDDCFMIELIGCGSSN